MRQNAAAMASRIPHAALVTSQGVRQDGPVRTTEVDFLAEILAAPDDDAPRLVLADWFEDHDDDRGEFIRLQCERARLPQHEDRWWQLWDREQQLLARHGQNWSLRWRRPQFLGRKLIDQRHWHSLPPDNGLFRRGLPEVASARSVKAMLRGLEAPERRLVREIQLQHYEPLLLPGLLTSLAGLRGLTISKARLGGEFVGPLAQCPAAADLRRLNLQGNLLQRSSIELLCNSPYLQSLESLNLSWNRLDPSVHGLLLSWPGFRNLRELWLSGNLLDGSGDLFSAAELAGLHVLEIGDCSVPSGIVDALLNNRDLRQLTQLSLAGALLRSTTRRRLFAEPLLEMVRILNLERCQLTDGDLERLAHSPQVQRLRELALGHDARWGPTFTRAGLYALTEATCLSQLRVLALARVEIDNGLAQALAESRSLPQLADLRLYHCRIEDTAQARLSQRFRIHSFPE